jgi:glutamine amidotransferase
MGNLNSVKRKFDKIGVVSKISTTPKQIICADKLVLPGVGHFKMAVNNLKSTGLWEALNEAVLVKKITIIGICLGMQLMAKHSEEGDVDGLGWFNANVVRYKIKDKIKYKIPHMGWNTLNFRKPSALFDGVSESAEFYFVHSYHIESHEKSDVLAYTNYEYDFCSSLEKENMHGLQCHPEKSHEIGEKLLLNFAKL